MAEKLLQTRIQLKYDTLANWEASPLVLKAGEAAVATYTYTVGEETVNAVKVKYGDGVNTFANLPEVTAVSKDLTDAIAALRAEYEAYVSNHAQEVAIAKAQQAEIDALQDIALADYKNEMRETLKNLVDTQSETDKAQDDAFEAYKTAHAQEVAADKEAQAAKDAAQDKALADYKTEMSNAIAADKEAQAAKDAAQDKALTDAKTELNNAITAEKERAESAEANLQNQINTIIDNPDTEGVINSINEFTQYIADHGEIAEGFRQDIDKNKEDIANLEKKHDDYQVANDAAVAAVDKKVDDLDASLAVIAKTGNVNDLIQTTGDVLVFNCGSSTVNVD